MDRRQLNHYLYQKASGNTSPISYSPRGIRHPDERTQIPQYYNNGRVSYSPSIPSEIPHETQTYQPQYAGYPMQPQRQHNQTHPMDLTQQNPDNANIENGNYYNYYQSSYLQQNGYARDAAEYSGSTANYSKYNNEQLQYYYWKYGPYNQSPSTQPTLPVTTSQVSNSRTSTHLSYPPAPRSSYSSSPIHYDPILSTSPYTHSMQQMTQSTLIDSRLTHTRYQPPPSPPPPPPPPLVSQHLQPYISSLIHKNHNPATPKPLLQDSSHRQTYNPPLLLSPRCNVSLIKPLMSSPLIDPPPLPNTATQPIRQIQSPRQSNKGSLYSLSLANLSLSSSRMTSVSLPQKELPSGASSPPIQSAPRSDPETKVQSNIRKSYPLLSRQMNQPTPRNKKTRAPKRCAKTNTSIGRQLPISGQQLSPSTSDQSKFKLHSSHEELQNRDNLTQQIQSQSNLSDIPLPKPLTQISKSDRMDSMKSKQLVQLKSSTNEPRQNGVHSQQLLRENRLLSTVQPRIELKQPDFEEIPKNDSIKSLSAVSIEIAHTSKIFEKNMQCVDNLYKNIDDLNSKDINVPKKYSVCDKENERPISLVNTKVESTKVKDVKSEKAIPRFAPRSVQLHSQINNNACNTPLIIPPPSEPTCSFPEKSVVIIPELLQRQPFENPSSQIKKVPTINPSQVKCYATTEKNTHRSYSPNPIKPSFVYDRTGIMYDSKSLMGEILHKKRASAMKSKKTGSSYDNRIIIIDSDSEDNSATNIVANDVLQPIDLTRKSLQEIDEATKGMSDTICGPNVTQSNCKNRNISEKACYIKEEIKDLGNKTIKQSCFEKRIQSDQVKSLTLTEENKVDISNQPIYYEKELQDKKKLIKFDISKNNNIQNLSNYNGNKKSSQRELMKFDQKDSRNVQELPIRETSLPEQAVISEEKSRDYNYINENDYEDESINRPTYIAGSHERNNQFLSSEYLTVVQETRAQDAYSHVQTNEDVLPGNVLRDVSYQVDNGDQFIVDNDCIDMDIDDSDNGDAPDDNTILLHNRDEKLVGQVKGKASDNNILESCNGMRAVTAVGEKHTSINESLSYTLHNEQENMVDRVSEISEKPNLRGSISNNAASRSAGIKCIPSVFNNNQTPMSYYINIFSDISSDENCCSDNEDEKKPDIDLLPGRYPKQLIPPPEIYKIPNNEIQEKVTTKTEDSSTYTQESRASPTEPEEQRQTSESEDAWIESVFEIMEANNYTDLIYSDPELDSYESEDELSSSIDDDIRGLDTPSDNEDSITSAYSSSGNRELEDGELVSDDLQSYSDDGEESSAENISLPDMVSAKDRVKLASPRENTVFDPTIHASNIPTSKDDISIPRQTDQLPRNIGTGNAAGKDNKWSQQLGTTSGYSLSDSDDSENSDFEGFNKLVIDEDFQDL